MQKGIEWSGVEVHALEYCCMRCGSSSKHMNIPGTCEGSRWLAKDSNHKLERMGKSHVGGHDMVRRHWRDLGVVQDVFGLCAVPSGAEGDEPLQTRKERHERVLTKCLE